jgi:hypothetical protein
MEELPFLAVIWPSEQLCMDVNGWKVDSQKVEETQPIHSIAHAR